MGGHERAVCDRGKTDNCREHVCIGLFPLESPSSFSTPTYSRTEFPGSSAPYTVTFNVTLSPAIFTGYALNNKKKQNIILTVDAGTVILFAPA